MDYFSDDQVPEKYSATEGRKKLNDSWNPIHLLKNPNKFFWIITAAAALVLSLLALIVILVVRLVRRIRYGKGTIRRKDMMFSRR